MRPDDPRFARLQDADGQVALSRYLRKIRRKQPPRDLPYLRNIWLRVAFPELVSDVVLPEWTAGNLLEDPAYADVLPDMWRPWIEFFISPVGVRFPQIHVDAYLTHAWLGQVEGAKRLYLWPPKEDGDLVQDAKLQLDIDEDTDLQTLFPHAPPRVMELREGQCAFIPRGWWHTTETLETSITLSGNFVLADNRDLFFDAMLDSTAPEHEALRVRIREMRSHRHENRA